MTKEEIQLITGESADQAFRVLKVDNENDLLLLRTKCSDYDFASGDEKVLKHLIDRMLLTLEGESGVGLAAPQIGLLRNIFLMVRIDQPDYPVEVVINPRIVNKPDEMICFEDDGCLSIPNRSGDSMRYPWIEVEYQRPSGEWVRERLKGFSREDDYTGVVFQHEFDHLQGVLYTDKLCE